MLIVCEASPFCPRRKDCTHAVPHNMDGGIGCHIDRCPIYKHGNFVCRPEAEGPMKDPDEE
jgi:hypothetical protein